MFGFGDVMPVELFLEEFCERPRVERKLWMPVFCVVVVGFLVINPSSYLV